MLSNNITKVIIINFCQRFHLYIHAYALLLQGRGLTLFQISTIESIVIGTIFFMEVPTGIIADRIGRKWSIAASTLLMMSAEAIFLFAQTYEWYIVIAILTGTGFAFASGAFEAMVYDSLPPENHDDEMKRAMGRVNSFGQIAFFIAPILGAILIGDASVDNFLPAIAITVLSLFIGLLVSLTLVEPASDWEAEKTSVFTIFRDGVRELRNSPRLIRLVMIVVFTTPFTGTIIGVLGAPYLVGNDVPPIMVGVALSVGSLLAAFTQRYAYKIEQILGAKLAITVLIVLPGVMYILLASVAGPILSLLIVIFIYGTNDMKAPLISAYQNALIASRNRATLLSIINMFVSLFIAIVAPIYAIIAMQSITSTFVMMGSVILLAGLILRVYRIAPETSPA